jgi:ABC-type sugar transport system substrate-binding protein
MCNEAGIPIAIDNTFLPVDGSAGEMVGQVACQYDDIGYAAIKWAAENVPNAKLLYVHGGPGEGVYESYQVGVDKALADFADKIEMVGKVNGVWRTEESYNVTIDWITSGGAEFNVIFANNDAQAKGVYQALNEVGMAGTVPIISTGGSNEGHDMLVDGMQNANMTAPANIQGIIQFGMLLAHSVGKDWAAPKVPLPVIPIDENNIDDWIFWSDMDAGYNYVKTAIGPYVVEP